MPNYVLHDSKSNKIIAKYKTSSFRNAALKAANKGICEIILREAGSLNVHEFEGSIEILDPPVEISKDGKVIICSKKARVKYLKKYSFDNKNKILDVYNEQLSNETDF